MVAEGILQVRIAQILEEGAVNVIYSDDVGSEWSGLDEQFAADVPAVSVTSRDDVSRVLRTSLVAERPHNLGVRYGS